MLNVHISAVGQGSIPFATPKLFLIQFTKRKKKKHFGRKVVSIGTCKMSYVKSFIFICICSKMLNIAGDVTKYGFNEQMKTSLRILCPGVDICDGSRSDMTRNEILDEFGSISCCHRCSCNEDCLTSLTCCFPQNNVTTNTKEGVSAKKSSIPTRSLAITNRRGLPRSIFGVTTKEPPMSHDSNVPTLFRKCVYSQTGSPDAAWPTTVPAYLMVTEQPRGGCKARPNISTENDDITASCDSSQIFQWGNLYPVYSKEQNTIYKNAECARCHGEFDTIPWIATLVCDIYDKTSDRDIRLSEHFDFLNQDGGLPETCFVAFHYPNSTVQLGNRCFVDTVKTCSLDMDDEFFVIPKEVNLTKPEIKIACQTGLNSPVKLRNAVYQNVFCAICNRPLILQKLYCSTDIDSAKDFGSFKLTYLLDTHQLFLITTRSGTRKRSPDPIACLEGGSPSVEAPCRRVLCPAGQTRNSDGDCVFVSKRWYGSSFAVVTKLTLDVNIRGLSAVLDTFEKGGINSETRLAGFKKTSPWPAYWKIARILRSTVTNSSDEEPFVAVELHTSITRPEVITDDIPKSLSNPWNLVNEDKTFVFRQSELEYSIRYDDNSAMPWWKTYIESSVDQDIEFSAWNTIYFDVHARIPYPITKVWTCQRVSLVDDEYTLMANNYLLTSNLTKRPIMFDREFEMAVTGDGKQLVHVCLEDTHLVLKGQSSGCQRLVQSYLIRVMVFNYCCLCFYQMIGCLFAY